LRDDRILASSELVLARHEVGVSAVLGALADEVVDSIKRRSLADVA
jgi:hypothetical protein